MRPEYVYTVLQKIGAHSLHHANTVTTSCTFLENAALLSRGYVETHRLKQTAQSSDAVDKKYGIWNAVFLDHIDIHYRGGRRKGANQYGPVLFVFDSNLLLRLPPGTDVRVTKSNPIHWYDKQKEEDRWYLTPEELEQHIGFGDFDKMLVITTPDAKLDFPNRAVRIDLDNPNRALVNGDDAYVSAEKRLREAAEKGRVSATIAPHVCQTDCKCVVKYGGFWPTYFDELFS
jgi:hypothetical protein